jgi:hypothetical protein
MKRRKPLNINVLSDWEARERIRILCEWSMIIYTLHIPPERRVERAIDVIGLSAKA